MRRLLVVTMFGLAACGGSHSAGNPDGNNGNGDGNGNGDSLGGNPTTVSVTLTNRPNNAATYTFLVAYQDGASAWQLAPAPSGDTYSFTINAPAWGFAWTCLVPTVNAGRVELAYFATTEKTSYTETVPRECSDRYPAVVGVSGDVLNEQTTTQNFASYAARTVQVVHNNGNDTFALEAPMGPHDLVISHVTLGSATSGGEVDSTAVVRGVTAPTNSASVDWNNSQSTTSVNVTGVTQAIVSTTLYTAGGTTVTMTTEGAPPFTSAGLDPSLAMSGDLYDQQVLVRGTGATTILDTWVDTVADQTYSTPTALGGATSSVPTTTPYPEIMTTWNGYTGAIGYAWDARQGTTGVGGVPALRWTAILGTTYLGGSPKFQMPDLSMLTGWSPSFEFQGGANAFVVGSVAAYTSSAGAADFPGAVQVRGSNGAPGTTRMTVTGDWTVTP